MKSRSSVLCGHSIKMALAAIEIYNKPDFASREQVFSILVINAWEALLKAKIVKDNNNRLTAIQTKEKGRYLTRKGTKERLTINLQAAIDACQLPPAVLENLEKMIAIRHAATHMTAQSKSLPQLVFQLGAAALSNYAKVIKDWFGIGLNQYQFYILPLGFAYPFRSLSAIDLSREPDDIALIVEAVKETQTKDLDADGFYFMCNLEANLTSVKKVTWTTDLKVAVDPTSATAVVERRIKTTDQYPYSYRQAETRIRALAPNVNVNMVQKFIADNGIKDDPRYAMRVYPNQEAERLESKKNSRPVLYNEEFVQLCVAALKT